MNEEELRQIAKEEMSKSIMDNLDSALIFTYITNLEKENQKLRDVKNKAIGHINSCKSNEGILSEDEIGCLLEILKEGDIK